MYVCMYVCLCRMSDKFFGWVFMKVNVSKCQALAISSHKSLQVFNSNLRIANRTIPFTSSSIFKFIGLQFDMSG